MKIYKKKNLPVDEIRKLLEPGPIVLVSSQLNGKTNIMTMGWYVVMGFSPSLIGCYIWTKDYSHELIKKSKECVINVPTVELLETAIGIGCESGEHINKFGKYNLTKGKASKVQAPLIKECFANIECKLYETKMIKEYNLFIFEVVKAHIAISPKYPKTFHYMGEGEFMLSGKHVNLRKKFKKGGL